MCLMAFLGVMGARPSSPGAEQSPGWCSVMDHSTAEECIARSIAPIKSQYLRPREPPAQDAPQQPKAAKLSRKQQRRQQRKDLCLQALAGRKFCNHFFAQGDCTAGSDCKFSHDVDKFMEEKPEDLPGGCPFSQGKLSCRFGYLCRWSSTHEGSAEGSKPPGEPSDKQDECEKLSGSVPTCVVLPVHEEVVEPVNIFSKHLQRKLRKQEYDFSKVDGVLSKLGIKISRPQKKTARSKEGGIDDKAVEEAPPSAKKQRVELLDGTIAAVDPLGSMVDTPLQTREKQKIDFRGKLYLSPLTTLGNLPFRRICVGLGADITCGEMALATNILQGNPSEWALLKRHPSEKVFGVQVCGGFSDALSRCSQLIEDGMSVDFVDVNMGCPIDTICDRSAGACLLRKVNKVEEILKGMSKTLSCPLTIKIRKGYDDNNDVAHKFLPSVAEWGASAVTLHGRSRQQRYSRMADWEYIYKCAALAPDVQLIGNGDIFSPQDWTQHVENKSIASCMIGRGALIKPWIFTEIKENRLWDISSGERLDILKEFCSFGLQHWGSDSRGVETTRRFLLEWLSFLHRYVPIGLLEVVPQHIQWRPQAYFGRNDLETLFASDKCSDWIQISQMLLGPAPGSFSFTPKHVSNAYITKKDGAAMVSGDGGQENG